MGYIIHYSLVAVRRCYENLRRTYLEQQSGKEDLVEQQAKRRKYRSRRERVTCTIESFLREILLSMYSTANNHHLVCT